MTSRPLLAGLEAGGSKCVCLAGTGPDDIRAERRLPTTTPEETLGRVLDFFRTQSREQGPFAALGVASFGPVVRDPAAPDYGRIAATPKPGWSGTDVAGPLAAALGVPAAFDTDVNASALAEARWGAGRGCPDFIYVTVGTGIGGGIIANGRPVNGTAHPELGHMALPHDRERDPFPGNCPFHGDCLEGLASAAAIEARWGRPAADLPDAHPAWALEAHYLALMCANLTLTLAPRKIILGGGVMASAALFPAIRQALLARLNAYVRLPDADGGGFVMPPGLGARAGPLGALALAQAALEG